LILAMLSSSASAQGLSELTPGQVREDFQVFCSEVKSTYAYFDGKATRWDRVAALYDRDVRRVRTREEFIQVLERAINELYDDHAQLTVNTATSPMLVPSGTDLWAEWKGSVATVVAVKQGSDAERAGIEPGAVIVSVNGVAIARASEQMMGRAVPRNDRAVRNWALRHVLAGHHGEARRIEAIQDQRKQWFDLPAERTVSQDHAPIAFRRIEDGVGYIRFNDSLGDSATIGAFDRALASLRDTRGLIVDLRDTPSGGNSTVARGILGRFVSHETGYQKHVLVGEERETGIRRSWIELVSPRGPFRYEKNVVVLIGRWTGSMGEGIAIGFDALGKTTVGSPMAQLLGATYRIELPNSKIGVNLPAERLYHVNGTPREAYEPTISVRDGSGQKDASMEAALRAVAATAGRNDIHGQR
jgi:carboxyl-terminal processing protease